MAEADVQNALTELRTALAEYKAARNPDVGVFGGKQAALLNALSEAVIAIGDKVSRT